MRTVDSRFVIFDTVPHIGTAAGLGGSGGTFLAGGQGVYEQGPMGQADRQFIITDTVVGAFVQAFEGVIGTAVLEKQDSQWISRMVFWQNLTFSVPERKRGRVASAVL